MWQKIKEKALKVVCCSIVLLFWFLLVGISYCFADNLLNGLYKEAVYTGVAMMLMLNIALGEG